MITRISTLRSAKPMSMQGFNKVWILVILMLPSLVACKKKITQEVVYDNIIYELGDQQLYQSNLEKNKQKTPQQYISILYSDLFNSAIPSNDLASIAELSISVGDKVMFNELILSDWLEETTVDVPTDTEMRADIDAFVEQTYIKFYLRYPNAYESYYLKSLIESDPDLTPEIIYTAFATSNEYNFY